MMEADVAKEMAPAGKLRVALNMRNELLVSGSQRHRSQSYIIKGTLR